MKDSVRTWFQSAALLAIGIAPAEFNWAYNPHLVNHPAIFWSIDIVRWTALPALIFLIGLRKKLFTPRDLGFHTRVLNKPHIGWFIAALIIVPYAMGQTFAYMQDWAKELGDYFYFDPTFDYRIMQPAHGPLHFLSGFYLSVTAGLVEEFYYRGLLGRLTGRGALRSPIFVILSVLLFLPPHIYGGSSDVAAAGLFALMAALLYVGIGNIWPIIIGHMLIDLGFFG
jgi:CAAX prenyl protease-like protein